jgi:hypothetical protein
MRLKRALRWALSARMNGGAGEFRLEPSRRCRRLDAALAEVGHVTHSCLTDGGFSPSIRAQHGRECPYAMPKTSIAGE